MLFCCYNILTKNFWAVYTTIQTEDKILTISFYILNLNESSNKFFKASLSHQNIIWGFLANQHGHYCDTGMRNFLIRKQNSSGQIKKLFGDEK